MPCSPLASGEIFCLAGLEMDGENPDWLWLAAGLWGAGSSAEGKRDGWIASIGKRGEINKPAKCILSLV